ncbi:MAG: SdpA family antimicrobial peptide system protein [Rhodothermales bacterium]
MQNKERKYSKLIFACVILCVFWGALVLRTLVVSIGDNPIRHSMKQKMVFTSILPEGWAFFTRDPRQPSLYGYKNVNGSWVIHENQNSRLSNLLGVQRKSRTLGLELDVIVSQRGDSSWVECEDEINICYQHDSLNPIPVNNTTVVKTLCGEFIVQERKPVPWAWSSNYKNIHLPSKYLYFDIACD